MTAFFVGRIYGVNLQEERSKNLGARNAGSVLGKVAFIWTFFGDALKGVLVVYLGGFWNFDEWVIISGAALVIIGHLFPIWLKCNGGKGIATFIGVGLALSSSLFLWMIIGTVIVLALTRSLTLGMVGGFIFYVGAIMQAGKIESYTCLMIAIVCMLFKHRRNIKESWKRGN